MKKKIITIGIIAVSLFVLINLVWFIVVTIRYNKFIEAVPKNEWGRYFIRKDDGYMYSVKKPSYLSFTGNLGVVSKESDEALIIWPSIFDGYEYGFRLQKEEKAYEIYVDENMNPIYEKDAHIVNKFKTELEELFSKANETWNLK